MRLVKIAVASVNTTVGAFVSNVDRAIATAEAMAGEDATVGAFQEQLVSGYPAEDLVQWRSFVERQWTELTRFAQRTMSLPTVFVLGVTVNRLGATKSPLRPGSKRRRFDNSNRGSRLLVTYGDR